MAATTKEVVPLPPKLGRLGVLGFLTFAAGWWGAKMIPFLDTFPGQTLLVGAVGAVAYVSIGKWTDRRYAAAYAERHRQLSELNESIGKQLTDALARLDRVQLRNDEYEREKSKTLQQLQYWHEEAKKFEQEAREFKDKAVNLEIDLRHYQGSLQQCKAALDTANDRLTNAEKLLRLSPPPKDGG